jgi:hypothetical protein
MMTPTRSVLFAATAFFLLTVPSATAVPTQSTHWMSLINTVHSAPNGMTVVIVPPAYFSYSAMVGDLSWVGANAIANDPATKATLEAVNYWQWMMGQFTTTYPQLAYVTYTAKVLGVDATPADLQSADIVVNTAMASDFLPFIFHLGLGLPTYYPYGAVLGPSGNYHMTKCTVWNTGAGSEPGDQEPTRLRNLVIHEFGHCLGAGHTGTSLGADHCSTTTSYGCFDSHPTDVMSQVTGSARQCLSNLNMQSLAEGYVWLTSATATWAPHASETFQAKTDYATTCLPAAQYRY